jgi:magnesium chelatase subunit I
MRPESKPILVSGMSPLETAAQSPMPTRIAFPFSALVGQEEMKRALLIAAVEPSVGGVMVFGDRGAGKSTAVRALAALLPRLPAVKGCAFHCDPAADAGRCTPDCPGCNGVIELIDTPVVDLPLGATEDRVVGALDLEHALTRGEKRFEPGLLARAHRGFLYIDEVNLLEDHLVDVLLDVAASGENVVEREGLSVRHPARFVLIGSGNPEEGELRPQLLDRFGLSVEVKTPAVLADRIEVVRRRDAFDRDRVAFATAWAPQEAAIRDQILAARERLSHVETPDEVLEAGSRLCMAIGADGLRGELTILRTARAVAALNGADTVCVADVRDVAPMARRHRLRRNPLDEGGSTARIERAMSELFDG